jgi:hypothetical protein
MNYNEETTAYIVLEYTLDPRTETVQKLAQELNKSTKSIIGKLSREGVYQRASYTSKTGEKPITKVELVSNIATNLGVDVEILTGLDKSPKAALKALEVATGAQRQDTIEEDYRAMQREYYSGAIFPSQKIDAQTQLEEIVGN